MRTMLLGLTMLACGVSLQGCASSPPSVPMAVPCPPLPAVPRALIGPPANGYLLQTIEPSKPELRKTP